MISSGNRKEWTEYNGKKTRDLPLIYTDDVEKGRIQKEANRMTGQTKKNTTAADNAVSVIKKLLTGSFVILFVGICAYMSLLLLMRFI